MLPTPLNLSLNLDLDLDSDLSLQSDDFELFGLPHRFAQERSDIETRWKELQRHAHPDRFAAQGSAAKRIAMQWSVRINEAHQRLKDPLKRAAYLCQLQGVALRAQDNTQMPTAFLMQQMQWREALEEADTAAQIEALEDMVQQAQSDTLADCARLLDDQHDYAAAAQQVRALMFMARFAQDIEKRREAVEV